jgi:glycosidase
MLMFSLSGMPLIYSGDEWLQTNDENHARDDSKTDGRWLHRPAFDWQKVKTKEPPMSYQAYHWTQSLIKYRKNDARFTANKKLITLPQPKTPVFAFQRDEGKPLYCVYNFSEVSSSVLLPIKQGRVPIKNVLTGSILEAFNQELYLEPYAALWLEVI